MEKFVLEEWGVAASLPHSRAGLTAIQVEAALLYSRYVAGRDGAAPSLWDHLDFHDNITLCTGENAQGGYWGVNPTLRKLIEECTQGDRQYLQRQFSLTLPEAPVRQPLTITRPFDPEECREISRVVENYIPQKTVDEYLSATTS